MKRAKLVIPDGGEQYRYFVLAGVKRAFRKREIVGMYGLL
jgi:hypothetical protein